MPIRLAAVADLPELLAELQAAERLAVDTEFHAERHYLPHLFLVQVHVPGGTTWLLDPLVPDLLSAVAPVLSTRPWWVHGGSQDLRLLRRALGTVPEDVLDTQILAGLTDTWYPAPFAALLERWCQRALDKAATLSDWSRRPLSERQVHYAAADAEALAPLAAALQLRLADLGRTEIARLACLEAQARALGPVPDDAWREVPGAHQLVRNQPAVLQELLAWRDAIAMEEDQAPRSILSDAACSDLARRQPSTPQQLTEDRRFSRSLAKKHGDSLTERIARAAARPEWAWPTAVPRSSSEGVGIAFLEAFAQELGRRERFASELVLPRRLLEWVVLQSGKGISDPAVTLGGWRAALLGDSLSMALDGQLALRLTPDGVSAFRVGAPDGPSGRVAATDTTAREPKNFF